MFMNPNPPVITGPNQPATSVDEQPLWMPRGSVRAILAVMVVATVVVKMLHGDASVDDLRILGGVLVGYGAMRVFDKGA